jgi:hypothetical protein
MVLLEQSHFDFPAIFLPFPANFCYNPHSERGRKMGPNTITLKPQPPRSPAPPAELQNATPRYNCSIANPASAHLLALPQPAQNKPTAPAPRHTAPHRATFSRAGAKRTHLDFPTPHSLTQCPKKSQNVPISTIDSAGY